MDALLSSSPIIACSTCNAQNAAISLIRISGFEDLSVFRPFISINPDKIAPRYAHFCKLLKSSGEVIDEIVLTFFNAPKSYTGENILEMAVHGNTLNVERILEYLCHELHFSLAKPGEFTLRAMLNKKLSLSQVEGLDLFLNANSDYALKHGLSVLSGKLHQSYSDLYEAYLELRSSVELSIDFLEDIGEEQADELFHKRFNTFYEIVRNLHEKCLYNSESFLIPKIGIFGAPNAGKSTLFNNLLKQDRSIVTKIAGTTRDYVSETIHLKGLRFQIIDTAGVREGKDIVEQEGINRSKQLLGQCFYKVLLINGSESRVNLREFKDHKFNLVIITNALNANYTDEFNEQIQKLSFDDIVLAEQVLKGGPIGPEEVNDFGPIGPKIIKGGPMGPGELRNFILDQVSRVFLEMTSLDPLLITRHKSIISNTYRRVEQLKELLRVENDIAILSNEINSLGDMSQELIGGVPADSVLNNIFSNFCIGK